VNDLVGHQAKGVGWSGEKIEAWAEKKNPTLAKSVIFESFCCWIGAEGVFRRRF